MTEWVRIQAKSGCRDVWLDVYGAGKPKIVGDPWYMPDGVTNVYPFIQDWRPEELPFPVWLAPFNGGKNFGDMLWTGGLPLKIASIRFIEALEEAEVTGYRTFDIDVRDHAGSPVTGYRGFATDPSPGSHIRNIYGQKCQNFAFVADQRVVETLSRNGVHRLEIRPYEPDSEAELIVG